VGSEMFIRHSTKGPTPYDGVAELKLEGVVDAELAATLAALG
jgi:uncharacterized protein YutE (UPF0331/DUF86 family)